MNYEINKKVFEKFPQFESERLLFRRILKSDAADLLAIRSNDDVMKFMDTNKLESIDATEEFIKFIDESFENGTGLNWGIIEKSTNKFLGYFGYWRIMPQHCRAEFGYALHPSYWGKGFMKETILVMIPFAFNELKVHSIEGNCNPNNLPSIKLLEKTGFKKEAHFRENFLFNKKYTDSVIYSLLESDVE